MNEAWLVIDLATVPEGGYPSDSEHWSLIAGELERAFREGGADPEATGWSASHADGGRWMFVCERS